MADLQVALRIVGRQSHPILILSTTGTRWLSQARKKNALRRQRTASGRSVRPASTEFTAQTMWNLFAGWLREVGLVERLNETSYQPASGALGDRYRVEVRIATWHADDVLTVPAGDLFRQGNDWKTFVKRGGEAVLTDVEAGHTQVLVHPPDTVAAGPQSLLVSTNL